MYNITEREPLSRTPSLRIKGSDSRPFIVNLRLDVGERSFNQVNDRYHRYDSFSGKNTHCDKLSPEIVNILKDSSQFITKVLIKISCKGIVT